MRTIYLCHSCATAYLPPEDMRYDSVGLDASPVQCSRCQVTGRQVVDAAQLPLEVFQQIAARFDREQVPGRPERRLARSVGPRRRGAGCGPAGARTRLG